MGLEHLGMFPRKYPMSVVNDKKSLDEEIIALKNELNSLKIQMGSKSGKRTDALISTEL